jgi:hypothetical protein
MQVSRHLDCFRPNPENRKKLNLAHPSSTDSMREPAALIAFDISHDHVIVVESLLV